MHWMQAPDEKESQGLCVEARNGTWNECSSWTGMDDGSIIACVGTVPTTASGVSV